MSEKQSTGLAAEMWVHALNALPALSWVPGLHLESSGSLLWLAEQRHIFIWLKSRNSDEQRERGRNSARCWSMSLARRFVCLILPASASVLQFTLFFIYFIFTPTDWVNLTKSFPTCESFCWVTVSVMSGCASSLSDLHDLTAGHLLIPRLHKYTTD